MANTENIEAKLCAYVDGDLDAAGRAEIEAHLAANPQHRQLMTELMAQRDLIRDLPRVKAPEDLLESMHSQLERSVLLGQGANQADVAGRINRLPQVFAVAAVLLLAIGLMAVIYFVLPQNSPHRVDYARGPLATSAPTHDGAASDAGTLSDATKNGDVSRSLAKDLDHASGPAGERREPIASKVASRKESADTSVDSSAVTVTAAPAPATPASPAAPAAKAAAAPVGTASGAPATTDAFAAGVSNKGLGIVSKNASIAGGKAGGGSGAFTNMFANAAVVEEQLKNAPAVADDSMVVVVSAGDPSAANRQVQSYLQSNSIKWQAVTEPMPEPVDLQPGQAVSPSRAQNWQMRMKSADQRASQAEQQSSNQAQGLPQKAPGSTAGDSVASTAPSALAQNSGDLGTQQQQSPFAGDVPLERAVQMPATQKQQDLALSGARPATQLSQQLIIARGVTRQQLADLNVHMPQHVDGRIQNFRRAGGNYYAPTTIPAEFKAEQQQVIAPSTQPAAAASITEIAKADRERDLADYDKLKVAESNVAPTAATAPAVTTSPTTTGGLGAATTRPVASTAPSVDLQSRGSFEIAAGAVATSAPSTQAASTTTMPANVESLDVVIVVQPESAADASTEQPNQAVQTQRPAVTTAPIAAPPTAAPAAAPPATQPATVPAAH
jgi:hypothetical protein